MTLILFHNLTTLRMKIGGWDQLCDILDHRYPEPCVIRHSDFPLLATAASERRQGITVGWGSELGREGETEEMRALSSLLTSYEGTLSTTPVQSLILRYRKPGYDLHPGYKGKVRGGTLKFGFPHKSDHITIFHHSKLDYI